MEGACTFTNELIPLLRQQASSTTEAEDSKSTLPTTAQLKAVFDIYEEKHRPRADLCVLLSGYATRLEAMDSWWLRGLRVISPWIPDTLKVKSFLDFMRYAPSLNFLLDK